MEITVNRKQGKINLRSSEDQLDEDDTDRDRLLFVDDDLAILDGYKFIFESEDFIVDLATDSVALMDLVRKKEYDMIILDYNLTEEKGIDLATEIHRIRPDQKLIFISGKRNVENELRNHDISFTGFFLKPLKADDLLNFIREKITDTD